MSVDEQSRPFVVFCILFSSLNVLGVLYPPDGGIIPRIVVALTLTSLAGGLTILSQR